MRHVGRRYKAAFVRPLGEVFLTVYTVALDWTMRRLIRAQVKRRVARYVRQLFCEVETIEKGEALLKQWENQP